VEVEGPGPGLDLLSFRPLLRLTVLCGDRDPDPSGVMDVGETGRGDGPLGRVDSRGPQEGHKGQLRVCGKEGQ